MSLLVIREGRVVTPEGVIEGGHVAIEGGRILGVGEGEAPRAERAIEARGMWVMPGFVDIHCHGGGGRSFQEADEEAIRTALRAHVAGGTTSIVPAIAACGREERREWLRGLRNWARPTEDGNESGKLRRGEERRRTAGLPEILGAYVEGPYFAEKERGAQPLGLIGPPDPEDYLPTLEEFGSFIKVWSLAPELPGALEFIRKLRECGVVPALGHSDASEEHVEEAVTAGARLVTHLYCAQSTFHRVGRCESGDRHLPPWRDQTAREMEPVPIFAEKRLGLAEMGLLLNELVVEVIADGKHVTPNLLRLVLKNKPPSQVCLITDAMPAAGMPPGEYQFLGDTVWVTEEVAYRADRQRYAGSVLTMGGAVRNVGRQTGTSMCALAEMAALTPARTVGVEVRKGSLEVGKDADVVVMDEGMEVRRVVVVRGVTATDTKTGRGED